ncbi:MAG: hypothetical protein IKZ47_06515 [Clostridia bacterium]|nr:hypothetical protein [Clostridia bacterium]
MAKENRVGVSIRRTASEVKTYRRWMRLLPICITISVILLIIGYIVAFLYTKYGAFTVMVNKFDSNKYALTLSESPSFDYFSSRLNAEIAESITNISGSSIPDWVDNVDGEHNGENYIAYTFYCTNGGKKTVTYTYDLYITNMTYEVEKAVRVRLYVDGEYTDYAHARTDGVNGPEPGTTAFQSGNTIVKKTIRHFRPGDKTKFTVVIWLEGDDPDCVDKIIGGIFKIDMRISVDSEESNSEQT